MFIKLEPGSIKYERCMACGKAKSHPIFACAVCETSDFEWRIASGEGAVYSASEVHQSSVPEFRNISPYWLVQVDLLEGPRVFGLAAQRLEIGEAVQGIVSPFAGTNLLYFSSLNNVD